MTTSNAALIEQTANDLSLLDYSLTSEEVTRGARESLDFLAALILTDIYQYGYPPILKAMWQLIIAEAEQVRGKPKYALGIPRGFSKTVVLKLYVVWLILFSTRRFILIVCNTSNLATNFVADVVDMLNSVNIVESFGAWNSAIEKDTLELKKFQFRGRSIVLAALGAGSSLRGLNIKYVRPDVVIMDDMQNRDEAKSPEIAKERLIWMLGTLIKACDPHRCIFIFVGNMYPFEGSILRKLKASAEWVSFITGAINAKGESIWPEHRTIDDLLSELQSDTDMGHPEIFFSEVMNDENSGTVSGIDVSKIPDMPSHLTDSSAQGGCVIIDPSLGKKNKGADDLGIGVFLLYDGLPVMREAISKKLDPGQTIQQATFLAVKYQLQLIICEGGAYQATLIYWFEFIYKQLGITGMHVGEITTGGMQKNSRIAAGLRMLLSGKIYLHPAVRSAVIYQITQWDPLAQRNKDELLDLIAYIYKAIELFKEYIPRLLVQESEGNIDEVASAHSADLELNF